MIKILAHHHALAKLEEPEPVPPDSVAPDGAPRLELWYSQVNVVRRCPDVVQMQEQTQTYYHPARGPINATMAVFERALADSNTPEDTINMVSDRENYNIGLTTPLSNIRATNVLLTRKQNCLV